MKVLHVVLVLALAAVGASARVRTGIEVLEAQQFAPLAGKRVGLITNHTGQTSDGRRTIDLLHRAPCVRLTAIFAPEHGLRGTRGDRNVESGKDQATGVPVYSLYERGRYRPAPEMLRHLDALVYDIQDIGARFYTYITTLGYMVEEAARAKIPIYVLDRPNPINGVAVEGPMLEENYVSFVGYMPMPIRHGMTVGELARMFNGEKNLGAVVHVIRMQGWRRSQWMDETGLPWVNPSPNIRNLTQATLYPGVCLLESKQVSVGRGTATPFQLVGAPWFQAREMAEYLNARQVAGVRFRARSFRPNSSLFRGQQCQGVEVILADRDALNAVAVGVELLSAVVKFHPGKFDLSGIMRLLGNDAAAARIFSLVKQPGEDPRQIVESWQAELDSFRELRAGYLLYD